MVNVKQKLAEHIAVGSYKEEAMNSIIRPNLLNGVPTVVPQDQDGYCTLYKIDCSDGLGLMTVYQVYPGVELIYNDFETAECSWGNELEGNILEINHCREGREECRLKSGACLYLGEGDLSIHMMDNCAPAMSFPLKHYRGITVILDLDKIAADPPEALQDTSLDILGFREKFCSDNRCLVMPARDEIEHVFSELYSVADCLQKPYYRIKVQELLLFLCMIDVTSEKQREQYMSPQVEVVKEIHKRLTSDLRNRLTIEELSKEYLINTSTLKATFKGVYGQPIATYMKEYRIRQAAVLLRQTQGTVADIANQVGYENQSKFATAFREIMNVSPKEYRGQYQVGRDITN